MFIFFACLAGSKMDATTTLNVIKPWSKHGTHTWCWLWMASERREGAGHTNRLLTHTPSYNRSIIIRMQITDGGAHHSEQILLTEENMAVIRGDKSNWTNNGLWTFFVSWHDENGWVWIAHTHSQEENGSHSRWSHPIQFTFECQTGTFSSHLHWHGGNLHMRGNAYWVQNFHIRVDTLCVNEIERVAIVFLSSHGAHFAK